jgi:isopentenyl diphosphate isomerase/L-lactate dehydrogenase-like FMN-dependent dehydrogenase
VLARKRLPKIIFDFVDGAAGTEGGKQLNQSAIESIRLQPRVLVNVEGRELGKHILGYDMDLPFGIAPMGMCNLTWPKADFMLADAAKNHNIPLCLSTASSTSMEDVYHRSEGMSWFQLYISQSVEMSMQMVDRAEKVGYKVLILTVDVPQVARRIRDTKNGFEYPFKIGPKQFIDFAIHPNWSIQSLLNGPPKFANFGTSGGPKDFSRKAGRSGADWTFLKQLRKRWKGKLIIKGVLSTEDAVDIKNAGADAIYVSNHGARQLDSAPAAINALPLIRQAVGKDFPLIFDSGIRSGEGIVKALALGADFVMLGRPMLYAIGAAGEAGLSAMIRNLSDEVSLTLAQTGLRKVEDVDVNVLFQPQPGLF